MSMTPKERAKRIYEESYHGWHRCVTDMMSSHYMIYHWSMPWLLAAEAAVMLFLAIWPLWCGVIAFMTALILFKSFNGWVAYQAWRRYDRLYNDRDVQEKRMVGGR